MSLLATQFGFDLNGFVDTLKAVLTFGTALIVLVIIIKIFKKIELYQMDKSNKIPKPKDEEVINEDYLKIKSSDLANKLRKQKPNFDLFKFYKDAFSVFSKVQKQWTNYDLAGLRYNLTPELSNSYKMQIDNQKEKNEHNTIKDMVLREIYLLDFTLNEIEFTIKTVLKVSLYDYTTNEKGEVIAGNKDRKILRMYAITFTRKDNRWIISKRRVLNPFR